MKIIVKEIIGSSSATIRDQGLAVYRVAKKELQDGRKVEVSFEGITMVISSFLNASIGKLYGDFSFDVVDEKVIVTGLDDDDMGLLNDTVIPNAKEYYSNPEKIEKIEKSIIGG
ncbi:MAG TPA: STAS-like domain-containing protein [Campylobacterales bacterium]|nr:STAS-like domain-containing protein [Campylobacterales bacterium]